MSDSIGYCDDCGAQLDSLCPSDATDCSGVLPITELRLGMMAKIIHPEYAAEYPNPVQIVMLERTQDGGENIAVAEANVPGCVDGWKAEHLEIIPNATVQATTSAPCEPENHKQTDR